MYKTQRIQGRDNSFEAKFSLFSFFLGGSEKQKLLYFDSVIMKKNPYLKSLETPFCDTSLLMIEGKRYKHTYLKIIS